jgi:hypothetical protein
VTYLDAAQDRITRAANVELGQMAMAARLGNAEKKSWKRWWQKHQARMRSASGQIGLAGEGLERAIAALAARNPEYIVRGGASG